MVTHHISDGECREDIICTGNWVVDSSYEACYCPEGYHEIDSDCVADAGTCSAGQYLSGGVCYSCTGNTYSSGGTASSCTSCPSNSTVNSSHTSCTCNNGYHASGNSCVADATSCSAGQYLSGGECYNCSSGYFSSGGAVTSCTKCNGTNEYWTGNSCSTCSGTGSVANPSHTACVCDTGYHASGNSCVENTCTWQQIDYLYGSSYGYTYACANSEVQWGSTCPSSSENTVVTVSAIDPWKLYCGGVFTYSFTTEEYCNSYSYVCSGSTYTCEHYGYYDCRKLQCTYE